MSLRPPPAILHVDLDAFFASVEQIRDPALAGRPVIVGADPRGGRGRGVVAAASYEARAFGVHSAMPIGEAYRRCPEAVFLPGRFDLYERAARAVRRVFRRFTPAVEPVSIDEAYLDLTGTERLHGAAPAAAERIRSEVQRTTRLPVTMGLATNRVVAKVASDLAKPAGFLHVWPGGEAAFLAPLAIERLPGIGPAVKDRLAGFNIRKVGDLARLEPVHMEVLLGTWGPELVARARGEAGEAAGRAQRAGAFQPRERPKSVSRERTFDEDTDDPAFCEAVLFHLSERACRDVRGHGLTARTVTLKLRYRDFTTVTRRATLATPTDSDRAVAGVARELFREAYERRVRVRLLGVGLANLVRAAPQLDLFTPPRALAWERLILPIDRLRGRYGFEVLRSGPALMLSGSDENRGE